MTPGHTEYNSGRSRRRHPLRTTIIVVIVLLAVLVGLDFAAKAVAESKVASEIQQQGFPKKPSVTIEGFPFLTQVISRNIHEVNISSSNVPEGPVVIKSINATMSGVHLSSSFSSGTVDHLTGTAAITFSALANAMSSQAGGLGALASAGLTLSAAGPNEVKASLNLVVTSGTAVWRITKTGHNEIHIELVSSNGLPSQLLSSVRDITVPIPSLPLHLAIQSISVTPAGLVGTLTGQNVSFGG